MYGTTGKHQSHTLRNADRVYIELWFCTHSVTFAGSRFLSILMVFYYSFILYLIFTGETGVEVHS